MKTFNEVMKDIEKNGYSEVSEGIYLQDKDTLIAEKSELDDADDSKEIDFSGYEYWVTTDSGVEPEGFDSIEEAINYIKQ